MDQGMPVVEDSALFQATQNLSDLAARLDLFPNHLQILARYMADGNEGSVFMALMNFAIAEKNFMTPKVAFEKRGAKRGVRRATQGVERQARSEST